MKIRRKLSAAIAAGVGAVLAAGVMTPAAFAKGIDIGGSGTVFYLNDAWSATANIEFAYGRADDRLYVGDWNGDGKDSLGVRRGAGYSLRNALSGGTADVVFSYGRVGDEVLIGDWDGDGKDTLAIRRGNVFYVKNALGSGNADVVFNYGRATDTVLVGDWDGDGKDTFAVRRGNVYYFSNTLTTGKTAKTLAYGRATDQVYVGDWNGDGKDTLAVRRGNSYYVANSFATTADIVQNYGRPSDTTLIGDWNGDGKDTLGVRRVYVPPVTVPLGNLDLVADSGRRTSFNSDQATYVNGTYYTSLYRTKDAYWGYTSGYSTYYLGRGYNTFKATLGIDDIGSNTATKVRFEFYVDDVLVATSNDIAYGQTQQVSVPVKNGLRLQIKWNRVPDKSGSYYDGLYVMIDPRLEK